MTPEQRQQIEAQIKNDFAKYAIEVFNNEEKYENNVW